jgi:heme/copper-type cytochrome/quinol oxidase subunit 1
VSTIAADLPSPSYLFEGYTIRSWLLTTDHKRIAILYLVSITFFFFIGAVAAGLVRLELVTPAGDLLTHEGYNKAFTLHGVVMVWFFLIPSIPATFGNFLIPMMIGARDLAFPRINLASWYIYAIAGLFTVYVLLAGGVGAVLIFAWLVRRRRFALPARQMMIEGLGMYWGLVDLVWVFLFSSLYLI